MNETIDFTRPLAKVTVSNMVFTPITQTLEKPTKCNYCGSIRKAGGFICHVPLLNGDNENTIHFYMCSKSCHTKFKKTPKVNLKIRDVMLNALNHMREQMKGGEEWNDK